MFFFLINDHTSYCQIYLMKHRSKFFQIYTIFHTLVVTQYYVVIKCFKCDLGGKYISNKFYELLALDETIHRTLCTYTPEQNGVAEREHRHIIETTNSLLLSTFVLSVFQGETILTAIGLINKISTSYISVFSLYEKLYRYALNYYFFRVFGCTCFIFHPHIERSKLSS